jgi:nitrogen fixation-related uncharacterized protein
MTEIMTEWTPLSVLIMAVGLIFFWSLFKD